MRSIVACMLLAACTSGDALYDGGPLRGWFDAGDGLPADAGTDGGPRYAAFECGSDETFRISNTITSVPVDTAPSQNASNMTCLFKAPGHEAFLSIDATAGDLWHVHVDPRFDESRPIVF